MKIEKITCPGCSYRNPAEAKFCSLCGALLVPKQQTSGAPSSPPVAQSRPRSPQPTPNGDLPPIEIPQHLANSYQSRQHSRRKGFLSAKKNSNTPIYGLPRPWFYLAIGLILAPIFNFTFVLKYMIWFLGALVHEMGHCAVAVFFGCPAFPAIRLDGHAAAFHRPQSMLLALLVWMIVSYGAWYCHQHRQKVWAGSLAALALLYPFLAFTGAKEFLHLAGGHGGELIFATIFFWRALSGGFYQEHERPLYAMLAWYLWGQNIFLCWNLIYSAATRHWYLTHGSFGLENDYVRIGYLLYWPLEKVAAMMLLVSIVLPPLGILWGWWSNKQENV